jgi:hypothetical protein
VNDAACPNFESAAQQSGKPLALSSAMMIFIFALRDRKPSMTRPSVPVGIICSQSGPYQVFAHLRSAHHKV